MTGAIFLVFIYDGKTFGSTNVVQALLIAPSVRVQTRSQAWQENQKNPCRAPQKSKKSPAYLHWIS